MNPLKVVDATITRRNQAWEQLCRSESSDLASRLLTTVIDCESQLVRLAVVPPPRPVTKRLRPRNRRLIAAV